MKNKIKTLFILGILFLFYCSCNTNNSLKSRNLNYVVIDTTHTSVNGFNVILGYDVIIKMNGYLYSATMKKSGEVTLIDRQLKLNVCE